MNNAFRLPLHILVSEWILAQEERPRVETGEFDARAELIRLSTRIQTLRETEVSGTTAKLARTTLIDYYLQEVTALEELIVFGINKMSVGVVHTNQQPG